MSCWQRPRTQTVLWQEPYPMDRAIIMVCDMQYVMGRVNACPLLCVYWWWGQTMGGILERVQIFSELEGLKIYKHNDFCWRLRSCPFILMVWRSLYRASYLKTLVAKGLISSLAEWNDAYILWRSSETSGNSDKLPAIGFTISWRVHMVTLPTSSAVLLPHLALVPNIPEEDQSGRADRPQWWSPSYVVVMSEDRKLDISVIFKSGWTLYSRVKDTLAIDTQSNVVHCT